MAMIHEFDPQVYPRFVWVMIGGSERDIIEQFYQCNREEFKVADFKADARSAMCVEVRQKGTELLGDFIWFPKRKYCRGSVMAHEATHAAMDIFADIGADIDPCNQ